MNLRTVGPNYQLRRWRPNIPDVITPITKFYPKHNIARGYATATNDFGTWFLVSPDGQRHYWYLPGDRNSLDDAVEALERDMANRKVTEMNLIFTNTHVVSAGKKFPLPARNMRPEWMWRDSPEFKAVVAEAEKFQRDLLVTMEQQAGRPLTRREALDGEFERPPQTTIISASQPTDRALRNYDREYLEAKQASANPIRDREMLATFKRQADERDAEIEALKAQRRADADPQVVRARKHMDNIFANVQRNGRLTVEVVNAARDLKDRIDTANDVGDFWDAALPIENALDEAKHAAEHDERMARGGIGM